MTSAARILQDPQDDREDEADPEHEVGRPSVGKWKVTGVAGAFATTKPPLAKPMNRMNRPMPTPIALLSASGTAFMTASRKPTRTRIVMSDALEHDHAHRAGGREALAGERERDDAVDAEAGGEGERDSCRSTPIAIVMIPAIRAVPADRATAVKSGSAVLEAGHEDAGFRKMM